MSEKTEHGEARTERRPLRNARHERFAQLVASGRSQSDAYREAYPRSAKWTGKAVWEHASTLANTGKVLERVAALQAEAARDAVLTAREIAIGLSRVFNDSLNDAPMVAIRAADALARLLGYYAAEKVEARVETVAGMSDERMEQILRDAGRL